MLYLKNGGMFTGDVDNAIRSFITNIRDNNDAIDESKRVLIPFGHE
jgi:hypothetical protein